MEVSKQMLVVFGLFGFFSKLVSQLKFKRSPVQVHVILNLKMNCKFQNKSGLYLGYLNFFSKSVSQLKFKKSSVQVHVIPNVNKREVSKQIWAVFGLFGFFSKLVSQLKFKRSPVQVHVILNLK